MLLHLRRLVRDRQGGSLIEYALICCLIALTAVTGLSSVGQSLSNVLSNAANALN
jgi:Flp pilus assembly pilin Flp